LLASGNVWFDHPEVAKVRCYTHATTEKMRKLDNLQSNLLFDWKHFDEKDQLCLRFSHFGFLKNEKTQETVTSVTTTAAK
jgi:hypothetical protein